MIHAGTTPKTRQALWLIAAGASRAVEELEALVDQVFELDPEARFPGKRYSCVRIDRPPPHP